VTTTPEVREQAISNLSQVLADKSPPGTDPELITATATALVDAAIQIRDGGDDSQPG
jgi:hypothetical protein